jgi:hypothetical protein
VKVSHAPDWSCSSEKSRHNSIAPALHQVIAQRLRGRASASRPGVRSGELRGWLTFARVPTDAGELLLTRRRATSYGLAVTAGVPSSEYRDHPQIRTVHSFAELIGTPFAGGVNAVCWRRTLAGDFAEVIDKLGGGEGIVAIEEEELAALEVTLAGRVAVDVMLHDLRLLREAGRDPVLNCIHHYERDEGPAPVRTDVFSWHADSAPVEADTWLCTYHGPPSEGLPNEEAQRHVDIQEIRLQLRRFLGSEENDREFEEALREHCFHLHYAPLPHARPYSFGVGNLWRIAVDWPGSAVPPCIHRAPETLPGQPRLLLIC